jgi:hypothetical protein
MTKIVSSSWTSCLAVTYDVRPHPSLSLLFLLLTVPSSPFGPVGFLVRGDRPVLHGRAFFCSLFPPRKAHHASVRYHISSFAYAFLIYPPYPFTIEISSRTISSLMNVAMHILPILISPSTTLSAVFLLAWPDPWPTWPQKFSTSVVILTPLIGGRSAFVLMNLFLGPGHSAAAPTLLSRIVFRRTHYVFPKMLVKNVVKRVFTLLRGSVLPSLLSSPHIVDSFLPIQLLDRDPFKRIACSPQGDSLEEVQRHPWFGSIDWTALNRKELPSPFVPDVGSLSLQPSP